MESHFQIHPHFTDMNDGIIWWYFPTIEMDIGICLMVMMATPILWSYDLVLDIIGSIHSGRLRVCFMCFIQGGWNSRGKPFSQLLGLAIMGDNWGYPPFEEAPLEVS